MIAIYDNKTKFYADNPDLEAGQIGQGHTGGPGGPLTGLMRLDSEEYPKRKLGGGGDWMVSIACTWDVQEGLASEEEKGSRSSSRAVPGAVVATRAETDEVAMILKRRDIRPAYEEINRLAKNNEAGLPTIEDLAEQLKAF